MTKKQMKLYRALVNRAAEGVGINPLNRQKVEEYRIKVLTEETGKTSSSEVNATDEYDAVMRRLAADAGDYELASQFCIGDERRMEACLNDCARQVGELSGRPTLDRLEYMRGILRQAGIAERPMSKDYWWMDYPSVTPRFLFVVLDKHRKRLVRRFNAEHQGSDARPVRFVFGAKWAA